MSFRSRTFWSPLCCAAIAFPSVAPVLAQELPDRALRISELASRVSPEVLSLFAGESPDTRGTVLLHLAPERDDRPLVPAATATLETDGVGGLRFTLNGKPVDEAELAAHAVRAKRQLVARSAERDAQSEARLSALLAEAGLSKQVVERTATTARVRLNAEELGRLVEVGAGRLQAIEVPKPIINTLTNAITTNPVGALEWLRILPYAHSYNLKGQGIGIWTGEGNSPDATDSEINPAKVVYLTPDAPSEHSTWTTTMLQKTAPLATVYYGHEPAGCHIYRPIARQSNPPVYLGSQSWNWGDVMTGAYTGCAAEWDDYVYQSRIAMFVPSGGTQTGFFTTTPGKGFNVFAVGGADTDPLMIPNKTLNYTGWLDPETGAVKPDGVTPGTCITRKVGEDCAGGVSLATPLAAAFAADLMSGSAFFVNQPQAVKAHLVAGATTDVVPNEIERDGPGMLNFLHTQFFRWGKWWNGNNSAYFDPATKKIVELTNLTANKRYRIAISWLVQGSYALSNKAPNMRMELTVTRGLAQWSSKIPNSTIQWIDFVAPETGTYTIEIKRVTNVNNGQLALALTVGEVV